MVKVCNPIYNLVYVRLHNYRCYQTNQVCFYPLCEYINIKLTPDSLIGYHVCI